MQLEITHFFSIKILVDAFRSFGPVSPTGPETGIPIQVLHGHYNRPQTNLSDEQSILSHLVDRLLKREGGSIPVERVGFRVSDYADIGD
jgi:hypothetical protein